MGELVIAVVGGLVAGVVSPIVLRIYERWDHDRHWAAPRKRRLAKMLKDRSAAPSGWRSLSRLCLETGMEPDKCRTLLIEIGARGGLIKDEDQNKVEGWTLEELDND